MEIPRHWRLRKQRYSLVGDVCQNCNTSMFPPRDICPECGQEAYALYRQAVDADPIVFTTIAIPQGAVRNTQLT